MSLNIEDILYRYVHEILSPLYTDQERELITIFKHKIREISFSGYDPSNGNVQLNGPSFIPNYENCKCDFAHYTTLPSAYSIIKDKHILISELNTVNDPNEGLYQGKDITPENDDIQRNRFALSFINSQNENFNLWRLYSNDASGVILKFKEVPINDSYFCFNVDRFYFNPIRYGKTQDSNKFLKSHHEFCISNGLNIR